MSDLQVEVMDTSVSTNKLDVIVSLTKGAVGQVPFVGSILGEIIGNLIPNQRIDRIARFLQHLSDKVSRLDEELRNRKLQEPTFIDLFEDGAYQAARALTEERIEIITSLVKNGLTVEETERTQHKHLMALLGELNDIEMLILQSHGLDLQPVAQQEFYAKHKNVLVTPAAVHGSTQEDLDKKIMHRSYKEHMARLGLLSPDFKRVKKGEMPEFDEKTGMIKASGYEITPLGRLLLRQLDLSTDDRQ